MHFPDWGETQKGSHLAAVVRVSFLVWVKERGSLSQCLLREGRSSRRFRCRGSRRRRGTGRWRTARSRRPGHAASQRRRRPSGGCACRASSHRVRPPWMRRGAGGNGSSSSCPSCCCRVSAAIRLGVKIALEPLGKSTILRHPRSRQLGVGKSGYGRVMTGNESGRSL